MDAPLCKGRGSSEGELKTFLEPILIRIRERNLCAYCKAPMVARCKTHGIPVCEDIDCFATHRLGVNGIQPGELTRETCLFLPPLNPLVVLRNSVIALGIGVAVLLVVIL